MELGTGRANTYNSSDSVPKKYVLLMDDNSRAILMPLPTTKLFAGESGGPNTTFRYSAGSMGFEGTYSNQADKLAFLNE